MRLKEIYQYVYFYIFLFQVSKYHSPCLTSWFQNAKKYHRVCVGNTSKIPVELVHLFFTQLTLHTSSNKIRPHTKKVQNFEFNCSTQPSPEHCALTDDLISISTNNLNIYNNKSWGYNHCIEQVVVHYMALKVGDLQQMLYQETYHGPFWIMDDKERHMSILNLQFWRVDSAIIYYFIIFSPYICLL